LLIAVLSLLAILYSKITSGRVINFNVPDTKNIGYQTFFEPLSFLHNSSLFFVLLWPLFAFIIFATEKYRSTCKFVSRIGFIGFISNLLILFADPFGIWKYFVD